MRKHLILVPIILVTCGILGLAHAVVFEAVVSIATTLGPVHSLRLILSKESLDWLRGIFIFLALSFTAATFISMKFNNKPVRAFYRFSAAWTGILIYLFFAAFLYGVICFFYISYSALNPNQLVQAAWIGAILMIAAFCIAIYGIINANTVRITPWSVRLPNLPEKWKGKKAVWISDIHLGQVRGAPFAKKVTEKILAIAPEIVFIGGDLYDGSTVDTITIVEPFRGLCEAGRIPLGVYFVTGNHEEFDEKDTARFLSAVRSLGMRILADECIVIDGMQVVGVDYANTEKPAAFESILNKINIDRSRPSILLKHEPKDIGVAADAGISLQISGHTHRGQIFPVSILTRFIFKGFDYGLKKYVKNDATMQVITSSGVGTWGPPLRVGTKSEIVLIEFV